MIDDGDVRILHGDALVVLRTIKSESVHCIVTSPPFWGLRDYGVHGQIGNEKTPEHWAANLIDVFREARRVLRSDGVMWLEVGDTYATRWSSVRDEGRSGLGSQDRGRTNSSPQGYKSKDLVGAPWMLAFALRADGWYLRSDTIWARPNPMPESVTDRPTKAHSYVFLLTKSARYFYDAEAIREAASENTHARYADAKVERGVVTPKGRTGHVGWDGSTNGYVSHRNARSVWSIATEPTPFAHFATFPQALVERCIKAGTSEHGCCAECGAPRERVVERTRTIDGVPISGSWEQNAAGQIGANGKDHNRIVSASTTLGWAPSCTCIGIPYQESGAMSGSGLVAGPPDVVPATVLDPFMGSGTTALVARRLGRHAIGIELNAEYIAIAAKRLQQLSLLGGAA